MFFSWRKRAICFAVLLYLGLSLMGTPALAKTNFTNVSTQTANSCSYGFLDSGYQSFKPGTFNYLPSHSPYYYYTGFCYYELIFYSKNQASSATSVEYTVQFWTYSSSNGYYWKTVDSFSLSPSQEHWNEYISPGIGYVRVEMFAIQGSLKSDNIYFYLYGVTGN